MEEFILTDKKKTGKAAMPTSIRITALCQALWGELARKEGLTNTGYLETTIRRLAREAGIDVAEVEKQLAEE
jgi:hypothetical protein